MGIIFLDTFTEVSANTNLNSHTPDTGTSWSAPVQSGTTTIQARATQDTARAAAGEVDDYIVYIGSPAPSATTYDIEWTIAVTTATIGTSPCLVVAYWQDVNNWYSAGVYGSNAAADAKIYKNVAGTEAEIASGDTGIANGDILKFSVANGSQELFKDTGAGYVSVISSSDTALSSAGSYGYGLGNLWNISPADDISAVWEADDFTVTEAAAGANPKGVLGLPMYGPLRRVVFP